ncbi:MAG: hypothetical protein QOF51_2457 [Chloroflexota bacterium]|jgi:glycogen debranching enzyme|nr:hypothetical protein [Chloroflexota bacterium]
MGTVSGIRTRRYHGLLVAATMPPTGRVMLVNGVEAWLETPDARGAISCHHYTPDVTHPDGVNRLVAFQPDPWPTWTYEVVPGVHVTHEIVVVSSAHDTAPSGSGSQVRPPLVAQRWHLEGALPGAQLVVRPLLSGRDYHALQRESSAFRFDAAVADGQVIWRPYDGVPEVAAASNGAYEHAPDWYRGFQYDAERARGLDYVEDLASPGVFRFDLTVGDAILVLSTDADLSRRFVSKGGPSSAAMRQSRQSSPLPVTGNEDWSVGGVAPTQLPEDHGGAAEVVLPVADWHLLTASERQRRAAFPSRLHRAADAYLVQRGAGKTIIAGYPWFTDWGRDTFISLRGLCLATGHLDDARAILRAWAGAVDEGMLPNRFPDRGEAPEFNAVDASLWFVVAVGETLRAAAAAGHPVPAEERALLAGAVDAILHGYARGTRYGIQLDEDGLLAAGAPGVQLTWMDAKVGDWVVTPRIGKPVEVQALWLNALEVCRQLTGRWRDELTRGRASFLARFWNESASYLADVVDVDHVRGAIDMSFRPNQLFAVGGLPLQLLVGDNARQLVDAVEARLWTPLGLRTLAPDDPDYQPVYRGGTRERDGAYHQGTVWPWLIGVFVEAWVRVRGSTPEARAEARQRFLLPLLANLDTAGIGHLPEVADGDPPHTPGGCPFQAWSVAEALRLDLVVLA